MWVPLHVHSQYSILDSTLSLKDIAKSAKNFNMPSVALTDSGNMFGVVDFFKALKAEGIKPILGCELRMALESRFDKKRKIGSQSSFPIVLLVKDKTGYQNLCKLSSIGFLEGFYYYPRIDKEVLEKYHEGLICLSGPLNSPIASYLQYEEEKALDEIKWYQDLFKDDFYFELQRHPMKETDLDLLRKETWVIQKIEEYLGRQNKVNEKLRSFAEKLNIKCVATNDIHYLEKEDWKGHEILLNVQSGEPCELLEVSRGQKIRIPNPKRKIYPSHEFYFKSPEEMQILFSDFSEAVTNTLEVSDKCNFEFNFKNRHYPVFVPPELDKEKLTNKDRLSAASEYLFKLCNENIEKRYKEEEISQLKQKNPGSDPHSLIKERLNLEFEIISSKGLSDYLLIVYDFISWAKSKNIPVGPGRGSAAGSIISYLLGITDIEPLRFDLFFERFINPERMSYPDIDVDICMERRGEVIDYTINKYGKDRVAQIITFGTMKARMAIKDVGRVLSVPLAKVNDIAKLVPEDPNMTLEKALEIDPELRDIYSTDEDAKMIIDYAKKIEGSIRNTSIHAAGIIISANSLTDHIPICTAKDSSMMVTQFAMKPVEAVGMLKIDFLGLKTLTSIQKAISLIEENTKVKIDWSKISLEDAPTYALLNQGKTLGVFQLESGGMQELARQLHIDKFEEIIAVGALYRPGPMDMIPSFINRKHKKEAIEIEHPLMQNILEETYGVMVYQEQVMQIASKLAGYSLGEGDVLRRAMGKKDKKEMSKQREMFIGGCKNRGIDESISIKIFDKMEKFALYGFNKSHAAAYAYLTYVTAYLKANYPREWMASLMTCDSDDLSKVAKFIRECRSLRIPILPPDVNEAGVEFVATKAGIRFAMSGIKGLGRAVVEAIVEERKASGPFKNFSDFINRIDKKRVGKKSIELLIDAGALDFTLWSRDAMQLALESLYERALKKQIEEKKGVLNFFSLIDTPDNTPPEVKSPSSKVDILRKEKELLGFYLTSHPLDQYNTILQKLSAVPLKDIEKQKDGCICRSAFIIESIKLKIAAKTQRKFAILNISDGLDRLELPIWPELYEKKSGLMVENQLLYAILQVENKNGSLKLQATWLEDLGKINESMIKACDLAFDQSKEQVKQQNNRKIMEEKKMAEKSALLAIHIDASSMRFSKILELKRILRENIGKTPVELNFVSENGNRGIIYLDSYGVSCEEKLLQELSEVSGIKRVEIKTA